MCWDGHNFLVERQVSHKCSVLPQRVTYMYSNSVYWCIGTLIVTYIVHVYTCTCSIISWIFNTTSPQIHVFWRLQVLIPQHSAPGLVRTRPFASERRRPLPPPPPSSTPSPPNSPSSHSITSQFSSTSSMFGIPEHVPKEVLNYSGASSTNQTKSMKYIPSFKPPEYSVVSDAGAGSNYQRLNHGTHSSSHLTSPAAAAEGYSVLKHTSQSTSALPARGGPGAPPQPSRSASRSPPLAPSKPVAHVRQRSLQEPKVEEPSYGKLNHNSHSQESLPTPQVTQLGAPPTAARRKSPPACPTPYRAKDGSPMPNIIHKMNKPPSESKPEGAVYSEVESSSQPPPAKDDGRMYSVVKGTAGDQDYFTVGETTATVALTPGKDGYNRLQHGPPPLGPSEGYNTLHHNTGSTAAGSALIDPRHHTQHLLNSTPLPAGQPSEDYSQLHVEPRPQSIFDPYASLSEKHIVELSESIRGSFPTSDPSDGAYSSLQQTGAQRRPTGSFEVDDSGYSKPWTSFTASKPPPVPFYTPRQHSSSKPSRTGSGSAAPKTKSGAAAKDAALATNAQSPEFEGLYELVSQDGSRDSRPPPPPPHGGSKHLPAPPRSKATPPPIKPRPEGI